MSLNFRTKKENPDACFNNAFFFFCIAAFICHHNSFLVYSSLEEPTVAKWSRLIHMSIVISVFICIFFATCGYLTFTGFTQGKVRDSVIVLMCVGTGIPSVLLLIVQVCPVFYFQDYSLPPILSILLPPAVYFLIFTFLNCSI